MREFVTFEGIERMPGESITRFLLYATSAGTIRRKPGYSSHGYYGDGVRLELIITGEMHIKGRNEAYTAKPGDVTLLTRDREVRLLSETGVTSASIVFAGNPAEGYMNLLCPGGECVFHPSDVDLFQNRITEITELMRSPASDTDLQIALYITELLTALSQENEGCTEEDSFTIDRILRQINADIARSYSVSEMANEARLSKSHFIRVFTRHTGVTPKQYVLSLRSDKARELLTTTNLSLREVGKAIGYNSESMFCTMFGRVTGVTPGEYRTLYGTDTALSPNILLRRVYETIAGGSVASAPIRAREAIENGCAAPEVLNAMIDAMGTVGLRWQRRECELSRMLVSAKAMKRAVAEVRQLAAPESSLDKAIIGTVRGDLHDVGKNLVALMLEGSGFDVIDLGVDVTPEQFAQCCRDNPDARVLLLSALLSISLDAMKETLNLLNDQPFRDDLYVMVGGGCVTDAFAKENHADAYTADAVAAAILARSHIEVSR